MEDYQEDAETANEEQAASRDRLHALADNLLNKRASAVEYRSASGIERAWRQDEIIFDGLDGSGPNNMLDYATGEATRIRATKEPVRSSVVVNIIRGRCETAEGRFSDILLPVDDKNWGLKVTPVPELVKNLVDERPAVQNGIPVTDKAGNQASMADVAKDIKDKASQSMKLMEAEIDDQLTECDFNGEQRKLIRSSIRLGTGIIKGPGIVKSKKNKWKQQRNDETGAVAYLLDAVESMQPSSVSVNPWNVYPSPGTKENIQKTAEYIWEKDEILPRDVRALIGVPGYDKYQLQQVLVEEPKRVRAASDTRKQSSTVAQIDTVRLGQSYEIWEYHGDVGRDDLEAMGVDCSGAITETLAACVVFINDRPVKVELNTLDTGHLPYDFFQWTVISSDDPWGIGIPRMMMWLQRIITAAWRKMMDNAGASASRIIIVGKGVEPADGVMEIGGTDKIFKVTGDIEDAQKAFAQFQLNSNQQDLQNIIELALRFVDLETSMPTIFQGESQEAPETLGATNIMVDSSNIGLRQRVKLYDDRITRPHIERYYHHNMQYNTKEDIKGDFNVDPRGTSVLLEKDQQAQTLLQVFALKQDPDINMMTDWEKAIKVLYSSKKLDILKSDADIEAAKKQATEQPQQAPAPAVQAAQIRTEGTLKQEQMRQESDMAELQFKAEQAELERGHDKTMKEMDYQIAMMSYAEEKGIDLQKLKVQMAISSASLSQQKEMSHDSKVNKTATPQVATPPTEPDGRAETGRAYEQ